MSKPTEKARIVVAISGGGRSLANLVRHAQTDAAKYRIVGVISSNAECSGNCIAHAATVPLYIGKFTSDTNQEPLYEWLRHQRPDWIALAGFLKPFPLDHDWQDKVINIHPALLPAFGGKGMYGLNVHKAVIAAGEATTGATIHRVTRNYDEGPILARTIIPVATTDPAILAQEVFAAESQLYPACLDKLATGEIPMANDQIWTLK